MAAAMTATPSSSAGLTVRNPVTIAGTGFANATPVTITMFNVEQQMDVSWTVTSDGTGNWTLPGKFTPLAPGWYTITATDGVSTVVTKIQIYT